MAEMLETADILQNNILIKVKPHLNQFIMINLLMGSGHVQTHAHQPPMPPCTHTVTQPCTRSLPCTHVHYYKHARTPIYLALILILLLYLIMHAASYNVLAESNKWTRR